MVLKRKEPTLSLLVVSLQPVDMSLFILWGDQIHKFPLN